MVATWFLNSNWYGSTRFHDWPPTSRRGYGLLWGVGKCSVTPPRLLVLTHKGSGSSTGEKGVALIGKGITFDTGGAALKSGEAMIGISPPAY